MHKKLLLVILCLCINYAQAAPVTNFSGLFLGEIIYSDTNQTTGYRFSNKQTYNSFCFPRAILNIDSILNEQLDFHISFNFRESCGYGGKNDEWNFRKFGYTDEGYIKYSTQYARADVTGALGVMYVPYGDYLRHSIPLSLTQALTQTQAASAVANFKVNNLTLDFFVFNSKTYSGYSNFINNFGVNFLYKPHTNSIVKHLKIAYMDNIAGAVNYLVHANNSFTNPLSSNYTRRVPGVACSAKLATNTFFTNIKYTQALKKFARYDLSWQEAGAMPGAVDVTIGQWHTIKTYKACMELAWQNSWQALNIRGNFNQRGLPESRLQANYYVHINSNLILGGHLVVDKDYSLLEGGSAQTLTSLLASIKLTF